MSKLVLRHACSARGAEMGRRNWVPLDADAPIKLRLTPLRWVGGDYDQWGAYWGHGEQIYCAWTKQEVVCREFYYNAVPWNNRVEIFVRATSREAAKAEVREILPKATYYR